MRVRRAVAVLGTAFLVAGLAGCGGSNDQSAPTTHPSDTVSGILPPTPIPSSQLASATPSATPTPTPSPTPSSTPTSTGRRTALFFGDSDFVGGGCTPDRNQDMAQIAADQLGYRAVIRGAGGTGYDSDNPDYGLPDYLTQIAQGALDNAGSPSLVVIEGGSNDTGRPTSEVTQKAEQVLQEARSRYPSALLVMMGPFDIRANGSDVDPAIVGALQYAAQQVGVPFLNAYDWLPWQSQPDTVCSDFDHPTLAGHQILGRKLADALRGLGA